MKGARPSLEGVEARRAALRILDRVLRGGQTVDSAAQGGARLPANDQALALAIVGETLRRLPELDSLIDGATREALPDDSKARMVLRLALAQKLVMSVPDHAIVATALPLVEGGPRRLVHGVLGTLLRRGITAGHSTHLPPAVEQRWGEAWGGEVVEAARRAIVRRPPLDLSFAEAAAAAAFAEAHGGTSLAERHVRLHGGASVAELPGYGEGGWWVQDLAASLPARLMPRHGTVLDACAAPGGKTMQLAAAGARVTALDRSESRLARLSDNLARTGLAAKLAAADAFGWDAPAPFDAVLVDAPCSATGTFRRHPEVLHRVRPAFIREAAEAQLRLLARARGWVRPGGSLVYSVCSLEPQEGEQVIEAFLAGNSGWAIAPAETLPAFVTPHPRGWVRILPGLLEAEGGLDGFFIARLVRRG
ncbi:MAG TPA: RsmB/NOP family class I SAM-dependent RNA methyltransferase [Sphingomicrobium sp.]|nr:RsmB/NOP family class I SAM-dependent RNA methyltransferase [Sphingomicrobium sp.]